MVERYRGKSSETNNEYQERGTKSEEMLLNWIGEWTGWVSIERGQESYESEVE